MRTFTVEFFNDGHPMGLPQSRKPLYEVVDDGLATRGQLLAMKPGECIEHNNDDYSKTIITAE